MTFIDLPSGAESIASPDVSKRILILEIDLSQNVDLRPALVALASADGWALAFRAKDAATGEEMIVRLREAE